MHIEDGPEILPGLVQGDHVGVAMNVMVVAGSTQTSLCDGYKGVVRHGRTGTKVRKARKGGVDYESQRA